MLTAPPRPPGCLSCHWGDLCFGRFQASFHRLSKRTGVDIGAHGCAQPVIGQDRLFGRPEADHQPSIREPLTEAAEEVAEMSLARGDVCPTCRITCVRNDRYWSYCACVWLT